MNWGRGVAADTGNLCRKKNGRGECKLLAGNAREKFRIQENKFRMEEEKKKGNLTAKPKTLSKWSLVLGGKE